MTQFTLMFYSSLTHHPMENWGTFMWTLSWAPSEDIFLFVDIEKITPKNNHAPTRYQVQKGDHQPIKESLINPRHCPKSNKYKWYLTMSVLRKIKQNN